MQKTCKSSEAEKIAWLTSQKAPPRVAPPKESRNSSVRILAKFNDDDHSDEEDVEVKVDVALNVFGVPLSSASGNQNRGFDADYQV
jgi:hypothetical protein